MPPIPDLACVQSLFASVAAVAGSDFLRREISQRMQERLDLLKLAPQALLDAGCGCGQDLSALLQRYPQAQGVGLDISGAMLAEARAQHRRQQALWQRLFRAKSSTQWLQADLAQSSLSANQFELLWSNLALHWHPQPPAVFAEWQRLLRVGGVLMFSCFGPDTLREVRQAFAAVDDAPHTLAFADMHDLGDMLVAAGFPMPVMDMESITVTYATPQDLLADVRAFGGNPLVQRRRGLMSRAQGARLMQALEAQRNAAGVIPLTFEVVYGHAFKALPTRTADGGAVVRFLPRA